MLLADSCLDSRAVEQYEGKRVLDLTWTVAVLFAQFLVWVVEIKLM